MPLPSPTDRKKIHVRRVECTGYHRADNLWDIEGHLVDSKTYDFATQWRGEVKAGTPVHEMWVRLTVDEDLLVHDVAASSDVTPYRMCPEAADKLQVLKGLKIGRGWTAEVKKRLGGAAGCTHIVELLGPVATTAYQTLVAVRRLRPDVLNAAGRPAKIDSCYAYASGSELVRELWPNHFTGKT
jgi:hypothetical protein